MTTSAKTTIASEPFPGVQGCWTHHEVCLSWSHYVHVGQNDGVKALATHQRDRHWQRRALQWSTLVRGRTPSGYDSPLSS